MIPDEISEEHDGDMPIRVDIMPSIVFEELWAGLASSEQLFGPSLEIEATRIWLNYTMQGREEGDDE